MQADLKVFMHLEKHIFLMVNLLMITNYENVKIIKSRAGKGMCVHRDF